MGCADICLTMDFDGYSAFSRHETRKAGKDHRCCECGDVIPRGASHHYAAGKSDGDFWTCRTCAPCAEIRLAFTCGSWVYEMLWETIREEMFPRWERVSPIDCYAKLKTQAAIDKCRTLYAQWQEERDL